MSRFSCSIQYRIAFVATAVCVVFLGCSSGGANNPLPPIKSNLQALYVFHGQFTGENRGRPPKNEAEFKDYLKRLPPERLSTMKVESVDSLFVSPRDNLPLVIHYEIPPAMPGAPNAGALAHEQTGSGGNRYVLLGSGAIEEMDETRFGEISGKK